MRGAPGRARARRPLASPPPVCRLSPRTGPLVIV